MAPQRGTPGAFRGPGGIGGNPAAAGPALPAAALLGSAFKMPQSGVAAAAAAGKLVEVTAQAHRELSVAVTTGILAAQRAGGGVAAGAGGPGPKGKDGDWLENLQRKAVKAGIGLASFESILLASPGTMERFNFALEDTAAVVG